MAITSALVLYAVIWFMVMFIALPIGLRTQGDEGEVVEGTHEGAPHDFKVWQMVRRVTLISTVLWAVIASIILWGGITVRDLDFFNRMAPPSQANGTDG
ncbi:Predicted secreted protein [Meinhardsimonia xiamenensis]|jgi:predicted secreted protein|uniref:Predicted secreted protein n=1 Tax=Meinhardsimonia xiamenensis TaxID=990712 RepID=A0A1G9EJM6_9RHOB|nr:DUF1467 family protein [Meinhardsimonia xiamenensis]PRX33737.1 putative secreted protein [Meinhardsimonia xiamenensis]SDK76387.1 Predicted secreted protein [Meinhardsimonia xiamenensis]